MWRQLDLTDECYRFKHKLPTEYGFCTALYYLQLYMPTWVHSELVISITFYAHTRIQIYHDYIELLMYANPDIIYVNQDIMYVKQNVMLPIPGPDMGLKFEIQRAHQFMN